MYILFEEHQYQSQLVEKVLKDIYVLQDVDKMVSVQYVGYFYNPHVNDCVFILPKVLLQGEDKQEVVAGIKYKEKSVTPEDIITPEGQDERLTKEYKKFIYEFAVWIYRAISVYYKANPQSRAILYKHIPRSGHGKRKTTETYLDVLLSLIRFNQENSDFVMFTIKNLHRGNNKINWKRTISKSECFLNEGGPIYLDPVNKKRLVNYEEELFVIFFSILNFINDKYGFHAPINIQFELIKGKQFDRYRNGYGITRLKQIKYKYFSDKALLLWDLCYAFFDHAYQIAVNMRNQEYLLAKNFNLVFEAMIDELIGTPHNRIPKGLADQYDGKMVDHMYTDLALTEKENVGCREVYYIGDSKYYKIGHELTGESIYKQYTYARNVVQWNVNLFLDDKDRTAFDEEERKKRKADREDTRYNQIHLQDKGNTEGYDVIPNFFISAFVNSDRKYKAKENIKKHINKGEKHCTHVSYQFADRLFDRDTMFLSQYDVNFLYVLYLYARDKANEKAVWREEVRRIFREEIREVIQKKFSIRAMRAKLGVDAEDFIQKHFYELNGRVFQPYGEEREVYYALALPEDNAEVKKSLEDLCSQAFLMVECPMGKDPQTELKQKEEEEKNKPVPTPKWLTLHYLEKYGEDGVLIGYYSDKEHLQWIMGKNDKGSLVYNVRLEEKGKLKRDGAHPVSFYTKKNVRFVVLYTNGYETTGDYRVFFVKDTARNVSAERMKKTWYHKENIDGSYFFYRFFEEVSLGDLDIKRLVEFGVENTKAEQGTYTDKEPMFVTCKGILEKGIRKSLEQHSHSLEYQEIIF